MFQTTNQWVIQYIPPISLLLMVVSLKIFIDFPLPSRNWSLLEGSPLPAFSLSTTVSVSLRRCAPTWGTINWTTATKNGQRRVDKNPKFPSNSKLPEISKSLGILTLEKFYRKWYLDPGTFPVRLFFPRSSSRAILGGLVAVQLHVQFTFLHAQPQRWKKVSNHHGQQNM